jgi:hypothetical protein
MHPLEADYQLELLVEVHLAQDGLGLLPGFLGDFHGLLASFLI